MRERDFEHLVSQALEGIPPAIKERIENVDILVQLWPTREQLADNGLSRRYELLGLYEGVPLSQRGSGYGMVLPDRIFIFQGPIEAICHDEEEVQRQVRRTVVHEVAHHFGISDEELQAMGY